MLQNKGCLRTAASVRLATFAHRQVVDEMLCAETQFQFLSPDLLPIARAEDQNSLPCGKSSAALLQSFAALISETATENVSEGYFGRGSLF